MRRDEENMGNGALQTRPVSATSLLPSPIPPEGPRTRPTTARGISRPHRGHATGGAAGTSTAEPSSLDPRGHLKD